MKRRHRCKRCGSRLAHEVLFVTEKHLRSLVCARCGGAFQCHAEANSTWLTRQVKLTLLDGSTITLKY